ncbi:MAG: two-component hybrid sensor and regulator, partial [Mariprofundaceae bacterium]|nr:two-component hybrid sensor and regulator [Mariprofundaceae bacterium]
MLQRIGFGGLGILVALLFWFIEALLHAFIFGEGSFFNNLLSHDPNELWMRALISIIMVSFGFYAQRTFVRQQKMQKEIRKKSVRLL